MSMLNSISFDQPSTTIPPITVTERARNELLKIYQDEQPGPASGLRLRVLKGGCSGMSYEMDFSEKRDSDIEMQLDDLAIFIDAESSVFMKGTTLDYQGGLKGRGFVFTNPNARRTCSCGDSFGV